ncbi:hypothetical protein SEA_PCORAL7_35 [Gordonia phage PCoral7]|uniref:Uncharacterized protein n=1 Tax=Gordonia phage Toast TaxID=2599852 RepID=A0A5J6TB26_9CAUD|nr:hypothetical protein JZX81_gp35 [Gordonia phage Toast]QFG08096.1 hypothetical protein PBI_TOAST_35 [Gordonia phage Toast]UVF60543.1 hypothetical protein SEA_PCORAL7_35 [Gordonia phage PCoral7]
MEVLVTEPTSERGDVDPVSASIAAVAGAAGKALSSSDEDSGGESEGTKWLARILGPAADELAEGLRRWTSYRVGNTRRIADAASRKVGERAGKLPERVLYQVLDDGSLVDDELGAEYFGGLLAASVTPEGRDDRAVAWTKLLTQMSSIEIRAHYLLYQQWWILLADERSGPVDLSPLGDSATLYVDTSELCARLGEVTGDDGDGPDMTLITHAISALARHELIASMSYGWGSRESFGEQSWKAVDLPFDHGVSVVPSLAGIELWGYAHGESWLTHATFAGAAAASDIEMAIPPLKNAVLGRTIKRPAPPLAERAARGRAARRQSDSVD